MHSCYDPYLFILYLSTILDIPMKIQLTQMKTKQATKRKLRTPIAIRLRVIQLRAQGLSYVKIEDQLDSDVLAGRIPYAPSTGTIFAIAKEWEGLPPTVRERDKPFTWHQIEQARIPWEGSEWALNCQVQLLRTVRDRVRDETKGNSETESELVLATPPMSNRLACWAWRVHQAAPDLSEMPALVLALRYASQELAADLGISMAIDVDDSDGWLALRPDLAPAGNGTWNEYSWMVTRGLVPRVPVKGEDFQVGSESLAGMLEKSATGLSIAGIDSYTYFALLQIAYLGYTAKEHAKEIGEIYGYLVRSPDVSSAGKRALLALMRELPASELWPDDLELLEETTVDEMHLTKGVTK